MVSRIVWQINPGDFHADTQDMTYGEVGAYILLLMYYWRVGSLPEDDARVQRIARVDNRNWGRIKKRLQPLFYDGWKHKRMEVDLAKLAEHRQRQSDNACGKRGSLNTSLRDPFRTEPNPLKSLNPTPATAPYSLKKTKYNSFFGTGPGSNFVADVDKSVSADQPLPQPLNKFQKAWMDALAIQLGPHDYAAAIKFLTSDKVLRDQITSSEIRDRGSGVREAALAWQRRKNS